MGLFDLLKRKKDATNQEDMCLQPILEIANLITLGDVAVTSELRRCIQDTKGYFENHQELFEESEGAKESEWVREWDIVDIQWIVLLDLLEKNHYICERDWKDEKIDFIAFVKNLRGFKTFAIELQNHWLEKEESIDKWCEVLDEKWKDKGICVAGIDRDSDSYVIFVCKVSTLNQLRTYAKQLGYRMDYARTL